MLARSLVQNGRWEGGCPEGPSLTYGLVSGAFEVFLRMDGPQEALLFFFFVRIQEPAMTSLGA